MKKLARISGLTMMAIAGAAKADPVDLTACADKDGFVVKQPSRASREVCDMKAWVIFAALAALLTVGVPAAEAASWSLEKACGRDVRTFCGSVKPGGGARKACVSEHFSKLSVECRIAIVKAAAVGRACKGDAKKLCSEIRPGGNSVAKCLDARVADLSEGCREAMARIEGEVR